MSGLVASASASDARMGEPVDANSDALGSLSLAALSSMPVSTLLVGPYGLAFVNGAAAALLARGDGLVHCPGVQGIAATAAEENQQLRRLLTAAQSGEAGGLVPVSRPAAGVPLLLSVLALPERMPSEASGIGYAMVLIHDPLAGSAVSSARALISLYNLTDAEAHVAAGILKGRSAKRIASARNVSVATVRSQIRQILAKTRCANQNELVCRLSWLCATP